MSKAIGLLAGLIVLGIAGTALAGQAAINPQGDFVELSVAATPPVSGTAKLPRGVGVTYSAFAGNRINANDQANDTTLNVVLHNNFAYNGSRFPACTVNTKGLSACSHASKIGTGIAEGELLSTTGGAPTYIPATMTIYNGKPVAGKNPTMIVIASVGGKPTLEYDFAIKREGGGLVFDQLSPAASGSGPVVYLTRLNFSIPRRSETRKLHGHASKTYLIDAPTSCHGSWTYSQTFTFANRPSITATDSQPCVKG